MTGREGGDDPRGLGGLREEVVPLSPATAAFRWWCWGREVPSHTPGACVRFASLLGLLRGLSVRLGPGLVLPWWGEHGPSDALGIEFPAGGVRSVDNYVRPSR